MRDYRWARVRGDVVWAISECLRQRHRGVGSNSARSRTGEQANIRTRGRDLERQCRYRAILVGKNIAVFVADFCAKFEKNLTTSVWRNKTP